MNKLLFNWKGKIIYKFIFILINLSLFASYSFASSVNFIPTYDTDSIPSTNPIETMSVSSYLINGTKVFAIFVAVEANGISQSTEGTLRLWNSTDTFRGQVKRKKGFLTFLEKYFIINKKKEEGQVTKFLLLMGIITKYKYSLFAGSPNGVAGVSKVTWIGVNNLGRAVANGVYTVYIKAKNAADEKQEIMKKLSILK